MLYKWLLVFALVVFKARHHPVFVSVTEIEHNSSTKTLTVSCKVFTEDLATVLHQKYATKIDLTNVKLKTAMGLLVNDYIKKHLSIIVDGRPVNLRFFGFMQQEETIISVYEAKGIAMVKKLTVINNILYENQPTQTGIIHVMAGGVRKSYRLENPDNEALFLF